MKTKILTALMLLSFCFLLTGCYEGLSKRQIVQLVQVQREYIEETVLAGNATALEGWEGVRQVWKKENGAVGFFCAGAGLVPSSGYFGFYYSPEDEPLDIEGMIYSGPLLPEKEGWAWHERDTDPRGDNVYYTERICPRFFYYESHF